MACDDTVCVRDVVDDASDDDLVVDVDKVVFDEVVDDSTVDDAVLVDVSVEVVEVFSIDELEIFTEVVVVSELDFTTLAVVGVTAAEVVAVDDLVVVVSVACPVRGSRRLLKPFSMVSSRFDIGDKIVDSDVSVLGFYAREMLRR